MTDDIDSITAALSGDKRAVLHQQLKSINREKLERFVIEVLTNKDITEEVGELRNELLRMQPPDGQRPDPQERRDRLVIEKEVLDLKKEGRDETRSTWRDVQNLEREQREVEKDLLTTAQRDKRIKDFE
jgi:hypothetical protein